MSSQTFGALYYQGLEALWQCSDEKQVYLEKLSDHITQHGIASLLDIGAGDGKVALPLSEMVEDYLAIEQNPQYAARLRRAGRQVIETAFPAALESSYDLVLMSHVISHTAGDHTTLVPPAWELVKPGGQLLVVTHRNTEPDHWSQLLDRVGLGYSEPHNTNLRNCLDDLKSRGETVIQQVTSTLSAEGLAQMITAMAYMASNGEPARHDIFMEKASEVATILNNTYRTADGFSFPLLHQFISVNKPSDTYF